MRALRQALASSPDELDDVTLARARRGDADASRAFVRRYERAVFALLSRMLGLAGQKALVEDLAQETFLRAFRALPTFRKEGPARLSTWLLTIATRLALDALRASRPPLEPLELARDVTGHSRADERAERRDAAMAITRAVEALPPEYRAAFLLREVHGLAYEDVARALDIEVGTVKSRLARARAALREALEELK